MPPSPSVPWSVAPPRATFLPRLLAALPAWGLTSEQRELRLSLAGLLLAQGNGDPDCLAAGRGLLILAFQEDPWQAATAARLAAAQESAPFLPARTAALLRFLQGVPALPPEEETLWDSVRLSGAPPLVVQYLDLASRERRLAFARLAPAFRSLCRLPDAAQAQRLLNAFAPSLPPSLFARLAAEFACLRLPPEIALARVESLDDETWGLFAAIAASRLRERLGDPEGALRACLAARDRLPQHVNLTLRAAALAFPRPTPGAPDAAAAVCLYTLNKAELFRECLRHLAGTDLGGALVAVLDNGSTDRTPEVVAEAAGWFPAGQFFPVRLPVNVGAPGARNWLLALPEVKKRPYAAFLDDDAFPQADWLARLLDTARQHPEAGAVGCAIVDRAAPGDLQAADFNLFPSAMDQGSLPDVRERLFVCDACAGLADFGLYAYSRPCLSVSGCCHLLSRRAIEAAGPFDIRFNPTQFDDLERDIRSFLAGYPAVYAGGVRVAHEQGSSLAKAATPAQVAQVLGNKIKLEYCVDDAAAERLWRENLALLGRDFLQKDAALREAFGN